ncbi:MAG TPA: FRG domain-containing protein [Chitinophagaceae bacterium]|jgi:hypothetical protein|nr:FRG domain-containing protein [Chitinophagaceae bacterium]
MPKFQEKKLKSFIDFVKMVGIMQSQSNVLWYRGCGNYKYPLIPSLYRHKQKVSIGDLANLENDLMTRFRQTSVPFHSKSLNEEWETLFFMQHYGIPTRLLDWTENPFMALFFAVMMANTRLDKRGKMRFSSPVSVWVLDPIKWNQHALNHVSFKGGILTTNGEQIKSYKPILDARSISDNLPVALYGVHNSPRIVAQRGVFMIFGQSKLPMEKVYSKYNFPKNCLIKLTIDKSMIQKIKNSIFNHGITESVVFPELDGLAKEIKRIFGFES